MTVPELGRLTAIPVREAWINEATDFTPWLSDNLDRLGEAVGLELELIKAEASLPSSDDYFSADIVARSALDDRRVLIENQLEGSDHKHLGQIMTYLAGLEARAVIWVAASFREAHLAAIKWLNENTSSDFAFFAVAIRLVHIGDSQRAPVFEVIEKPNVWEKQLQAATRDAAGQTELAEQRKDFWRFLIDRHPGFGIDGDPGGVSSRWRTSHPDIVISYFIAKDRVGLFLRGKHGEDASEARLKLEPIAPWLEEKLGIALDSNRADHFFVTRCEGDYMQETDRARLADWLAEKVTLYEEALKAIPSAPST